MKKTQMRKRVKTAEGWDTTEVRILKGGKTSFSATYKMHTNLTKAFAEALDRKIADMPNVKSVGELTDAEYMEHYKRFDDRSRAAEADLMKAFKELNAQQKAVVIANLPKTTGVKKDFKKKDLNNLFDMPEWISLGINLATPILTQLTKDEAVAALQMIGAAQIDILANPLKEEALELGIAKMSKSYNETTLSDLKTALYAKMTQPGGTSLPELTEAVEDIYDFADERRAGLIARTESVRTSNWANKTAWQMSGTVKTVQWYTAEDQKVCPFCDDMKQRGPVPIDQNFLNSGETLNLKDGGGSMTADYGDVDGPPLHPDCRCYLRPVDISI